MSYFEDYQGREPRWTAYESSKYDSYDRPHDSGRNELMASLVPVRVIERGHVDPARSLQKTKTATFWDSSDNCVNYVVYPGADDYHLPNSSSYDYDYDYYGRSATDDDYRTSSYGYRRRSSSPNDHGSHERSAAHDYSLSSSPKYSRPCDDYSDNYRSSSAFSRRDDHHQYKSYDAYRYRC